MSCPACSGSAPRPMMVTSRTGSVSMTSAFITPSTRDSGSVRGSANGSTCTSSGGEARSPLCSGSLCSVRSVARSGSSMAAVSSSESAANTFAASRYALSATAACAFVHQPHSFVCAMNAAMSSRSPTDHVEGPRILVNNLLHWPAVEVGAVSDQLDDVEYWQPGDHANEREQDLRPETVATTEEREAHAYSSR